MKFLLRFLKIDCLFCSIYSDHWRYKAYRTSKQIGDWSVRKHLVLFLLIYVYVFCLVCETKTNKSVKPMRKFCLNFRSIKHIIIVACYLNPKTTLYRQRLRREWRERQRERRRSKTNCARPSMLPLLHFTLVSLPYIHTYIHHFFQFN